MADYEFTTRWRVAAPAQIVWDEIYEVEQWPAWWKGLVRVEQVGEGDANGLGSRWRLTWRGLAPYLTVLDIQITRIESPSVLEGVVSGDLTGWGCWQLSDEGRETVVRYDWRVDLAKPRLRLFTPLLRPFFRWNHMHLMRAGHRGLARRLQKELVH